MRTRQIAVVLTLLGCLWSAAAPRLALADQLMFLVVETRVNAVGKEVSGDNPQERRYYISNLFALPPDERSYTIKKKLLTYFNANVVDPAAKKGVEIDYYDNEMEINGGSVIAVGSKTEAEALLAREANNRKERGGNVYNFIVTLGPAKGEETTKPTLVHRDKEYVHYDATGKLDWGNKTNPNTTKPADTPKPVDPPAPALPTTPQILKSTFVLRADRMQRYWKSPNTDNYWSWMPEGSFWVLGPLGTGSTFAIDFILPDGKPWYTTETLASALAPNVPARIGIAGGTGHMDKRGRIETGVYGFKIRLVNELAGTNTTMMSGKFKVGKLHHGNALPAFKNQFEYYIDHDWTLPMGYIWLDWLTDPMAPQLKTEFWFKGKKGLDSTTLAAYVFFNGKQIGSTKQMGSANSSVSILTNSDDDGDPHYERWLFNFPSVRGWNTDTSANRYDAHFLAANPGEYQVKVLREGKLVRTAKFTVGADGKIVDNGLVAKNKIGGIAMLVPVQVSGDSDGKVDPLAWKTDAFYGNPVSGFTAP